MKIIHARVAVISSNTNTFGLRGHVLITDDKQAFQVGLNHLNKLELNQIIRLTWADANWEAQTDKQAAILSELVRALSCEIPSQLQEPPPPVFQEAWEGTVWLIGSRRARAGIACPSPKSEAERKVWHPQSRIVNAECADQEFLSLKRNYPGWVWSYVSEWFKE